MCYTFTLRGEVPSKKNSRITLRNGKTIPSKTFQAWHSDTIWELAKQMQLQKFPNQPAECPLSITIQFVHGSLRRRDSDNGVSSVLDALTDAGILKDDNWEIVRELHVQNYYCKNDPCCNITITSL